MPRTPSILVVDDDRDTRELYRACFDLSGFLTAEATTGEDAIAVARRLLRDILLTDLGVTRALLKPCLPEAMLREVRRALRQAGA